MNMKLNFRHFEQIADKLYHLLLFLFWLFMLYGCDELLIATSTLICVAIHEISHTLAFIIVNRPLLPHTRINGLKISVGYISYKQKLFATAAGPAANLVAAALILPFAWVSDYASVLGLLNLLTAISNLIPISGTDGYNLILIALNSKEFSKKAYFALDVVSLLLNVSIFLASSYCVLRIGQSYWMWGFFFFSVIRSLEMLRKSFF